MLASGITCDLSGPNRSCQSFDFSIRFENIVLSILPNAIFLLIWFAARLPHLLYRKKTLCRHADWLLWLRVAIPIINLVFNAALLAEQQTQLVSTTTPYYHGLGDATFPAALAVSLCTCALSIFATYLERIHVIGGNFLLPTWLLLTTLFDAARLRTFVLLGLLSSHKAFFALFSVTVSLRAVSLILDTINTANSTQSVEEEDDDDAVTNTAPTHEQSASFMNRLGFFWLFPLLVQGSRRPLDLHSLDPLREEFDSILVKEQLLDVWQPSNSLLWACIKAFPVSLLIKPAIPRLITTAAQLGRYDCLHHFLYRR
jgi:ATP-binding cassette subfamily C (CFTR/MRP) protein 1